MTNLKLSPAELQAYAFVRFTGIKVKHKHSGYWLCEYKNRLFTLTPDEVLSFSRQMKWITNSIGEINPLPKMAGYTHVHNRLMEHPFSQYLCCENYYQAYIFTKDLNFLRCLAACFYQSESEFNDGNTLNRAKDFEKVPFHVLHTVFLWYYGLKFVLQQSFPHFFQKVEMILEDEQPKAPNMREQINNIIRALTGGDVTKVKEIYRVETWAALAELNAKALENKELEARMKKYKK
jgi:hypothetical protein